MRQSIRTLVRVGFAGAIAVFMPAASCTGGERNNNDDGACPSDAKCSPNTPNGLHFLGVTIGDGFFDVQQIKVTAQGGTQTVRIEVGDDSGPLAPFELPYTASVDGTAATITSQSGNVVVLRGGAAKDDYLRIDDPAGRLYDRVWITSRPLVRVALRYTLSDWLANVSVDVPALYAPGSVGYLSLLGPDDWTIVDDSMRITGDGITQVGWDQFAIGQLAAGIHGITAVAAGQTHQVQIEVAPGPDRLETPVLPRSLAVGVKSTVCAVAFRADRHIHVPWTFTAVNAEVSRSTAECVGIIATKPGTVVVHATAGGLAIDREIPSVQASSRSAEHADPFDALRATIARRAPGAITFGDTAGERAAMQP